MESPTQHNTSANPDSLIVDMVQSEHPNLRARTSGAATSVSHAPPATPSSEPALVGEPPHELFGTAPANQPQVSVESKLGQAQPLAAEPGAAAPPPTAEAVTSEPGTWANIPHQLYAGAKALSAHIVEKFHVTPAHASRVVAAAVNTSVKTGLPASLMLAVVAVESGFNEQAHNSGARGLMQIIPRWHPEKIKAIGGPGELFKVEKNIATGGAILREYIDKAGSTFSGLHRYNGSAHAKQYSEKVLGEKSRLDRVLAANAVATPVVSLR